MANSGITKTYDPKAHVITFKGIIFTDFSEDAFIEITSEPNFEMAEGVDGSENRVNKNKTGCDVNVTLQQASITNDALSDLLNADQIDNSGKGPFTIKDLNGTTVVYSAQAYIKGFPDNSKGGSMGSNTWAFRLPQAQRHFGGNL